MGDSRQTCIPGAPQDRGAVCPQVGASLLSSQVISQRSLAIARGYLSGLHGSSCSGLGVASSGNMVQVKDMLENPTGHTEKLWRKW